MERTMITVGMDIGSITTKAAMMRDGVLLGTKVIFTGYNAESAGSKVFTELLDETGIAASSIQNRIDWIRQKQRQNGGFRYYGNHVPCRGRILLNPRVRFIIDIGGQDSKAILLDDSGKVRDFAMNDKCAAGTGVFSR